MPTSLTLLNSSPSSYRRIYLANPNGCSEPLKAPDASFTTSNSHELPLLFQPQSPTPDGSIAHQFLDWHQDGDLRQAFRERAAGRPPMDVADVLMPARGMSRLAPNGPKSFAALLY